MTAVVIARLLAWQATSLFDTESMFFYYFQCVDDGVVLYGVLFMTANDD